MSKHLRDAFLGNTTLSLREVEFNRLSQASLAFSTDLHLVVVRVEQPLE